MNQNLISKAIERTELYTEAEAKILQELIRISDDCIAVASAKYLIDSLSLSKTAVYDGLKFLQRDGVITKLPTKQNCYRISNERLNYITQLYNKNSITS